MSFFTRPSTFSVLFSDLPTKPGVTGAVMKGYMDAHGLELSTFISDTFLSELESSGTFSCGAGGVGFGSTLASYMFITSANTVASALKYLDIAIQENTLADFDGGGTPTPGTIIVYDAGGCWTIARPEDSGAYGLVDNQYMVFHGSSISSNQFYPVISKLVFATSADAYRKSSNELTDTLDTVLYHLAREDTRVNWSWITNDYGERLITSWSSANSFTVASLDAKAAQDLTPGSPIRFSTSYGGTYRYGIIDSTTGGYFTFSGPSFASSAGIWVEVGNRDLVRVLHIPIKSTSTGTAWDAAASTQLIVAKNYEYLNWTEGRAYCVKFGAWTYAAGTGTTNAKVNCLIAGAYISTANSTAGIQPTSSAWTYAPLNASYYDVDRNDRIEITTDGVGSVLNSYGLVVDLVFVLQ